MSTLYVDYTRSIPANQTKVHGGAVYTRTLLINLLRYLGSNHISKKIILLWPKGYEPNSDTEKIIYKNQYFIIQTVDRLDGSIEFEPNSTLFVPLLAVKDFPVLKSLKEKNIDIVLTIHGLRQLDLKFDFYDLKYELSLLNKVKVFWEETLLPLKKCIYKYLIKKYVRYVDSLITVSNYTLASLTKFCEVNEIILQYEDANLAQLNFDENVNKQPKDRYILFVSGNRPEKNLARSIDAFKKYVKKIDFGISLYVVGSSDKTKRALTKALNLKSFVDKKNIVFFDYVNDAELAALYKNAEFLLYTSKSEGFGLPALEASKYECPVVAAYGTSIPEVLGPNCIYVNPYSVDSIAEGMMRMSDLSEQKSMRLKLENAFENVLPKIYESNTAVIQRLLK